MDFKKITLAELEAHLGAGKKVGSEYQWQCPYCNDKHCNNLTFNPSKGIVWCFASSGEHSKQWLKEIWQKNKPVNFNNKQFTPVKTEKKEKNQDKINVYIPEKQEELIIYQQECTYSLLDNDILLKKLEDIRGINRNTVIDCGIGFDVKRNSFAIPNYQYSTNTDCYLIGFEYRPADFQKRIIRSKNTPTELTMINCFTPETEILAIVEGYMDGFALYQFLKENNQSQYYHIVTPCNGVGMLSKQINAIEFSKYKICYLYVDNDEPGNKAANELLEEFPFLKRVNMNCGCKDFNEHYLKCIKKNTVAS